MNPDSTTDSVAPSIFLSIASFYPTAQRAIYELNKGVYSRRSHQEILCSTTSLAPKAAHKAAMVVHLAEERKVGA